MKFKEEFKEIIVFCLSLTIFLNLWRISYVINIPYIGKYLSLFNIFNWFYTDIALSKLITTICILIIGIIILYYLISKTEDNKHLNIVKNQ